MKKYIKTFSKREGLSALFSALMIILSFWAAAIIGAINDSIPILLCIWAALTLISLMLSHRFYLLEHRRSNSLGGRILHDGLIAVFLFVIPFVLLHITDYFYSWIGYVSNLIILVVTLILIGEIILSLINLLLKLFKWRVW